MMNSCSCNSAPILNTFACCEKEDFVQDQICKKETLSAGARSVIYETNLGPSDVYVSGYVQFEAAPSGGLFGVVFLRNGSVVESATDYMEGQAFTFTKTDFDQIRVDTNPAVAGDYVIDYCLTIRYPVS